MIIKKGGVIGERAKPDGLNLRFPYLYCIHKLYNVGSLKHE